MNTLVTKERISVPENYTTTDGEQKTFWHDIGYVTTFTKTNDDGTTSVSKQLFIPTLNLKAQIFTIKS